MDYQEYIGDDMQLAGTRNFGDCVSATAEEVIIFGWVSFTSREARDRANALVAADPRMDTLIAPLVNSTTPIFDASRMAYAGFSPLIQG